MKPTPHEVHKQHTFDSFCKKVLKHEACDFYNEINRQKEREMTFTDLDAQTAMQLSVTDEYPFESHHFDVLGYDIAIRNSLLADALEAIPERKRIILLLHHAFQMSDVDIGRHLGMVPRTVQYQRANTLRKLKTMLEGFDDE